MKKLITFLLTLCLFATLSIPAFAAGKDFKADYFPTGKLQAPEVPYIKDESKEHNGSSYLSMYYYQMPDLQKLALDIQKQGDAFYKQYGIDNLETFLQVDAKFGDGQWLSTKGKWDELNEDGWFVYGENMSEMNGDFRLKGEKHVDDGAKLQSFTQSFLGFDREAAENQFLLPYVKTEQLNEVDKRNYFDFSELTITYRIRWVVRCLIDEYKETRNEFVLTSDWSDEVSIGKNGKQEDPKMPEKLEAPVLSEFELKANEDGSGDIKYFVSIPDSIYQAERYQLIVKNGFEPYALEAQVKINDSDWQDSYVANNVWLDNGYRVADGSGMNLKISDDAWIRVRVVSTQDENEKTEWSNIIGTKAVEGEGNPKNPDGKLQNGKTKCKVCGICPIQPLGICLFIWLAIILVVILVIVIIVVVAKKNKDKKKKQQ